MTEKWSVYYDPKEKVIVADLTGLALSEPILRKMAAEVVQLAKSLSEKVFMISCWKVVKIDDNFGKYFPELTAELLRYTRGIVRYEATEVLTRANIRTQTVKHHHQNTQSHIYATREEALAAIRKLEKEQL